MKKLMLLDGMAIVYRAYYALNRSPRLNSKGLNTSAILGFTTTLYDLMSQQRPTHIAVAFDLHTPTFRHEMYEPYKANRDATPEDILIALPYICQLLEAFRIPRLTCEGYEADDLPFSIDDRKFLDLMFLEDLLDISPVCLVVTDGDKALARHGVFYLHARICDEADVAVGHDSDELVVFGNNRNAPDMVLRH